MMERFHQQIEATLMACENYYEFKFKNVFYALCTFLRHGVARKIWDVISNLVSSLKKKAGSLPW